MGFFARCGSIGFARSSRAADIVNVDEIASS
jgi:hypothetical protein